MANPNQYDVGDAVRISTSTPFQDAAETAFDPDVVTGKIKDPNGSVTEFVLSPSGEQGQLVKDAVGDYHFDVDVNAAGDWYYRIEGEASDGAHRGADEGKFQASATEF